MNLMTKILTLLGEVVALYGLYATHIISGESALLIGLITVVFVLVVGDMKNSLEKSIQGVSTTAGNISMYIITRDGLAAGYFSTQSPIRLTPMANKVLEESGAQKLLNEKLEESLDKLADLEPKDEVDVMGKAYKVSDEIISSKDFAPVKNFVYEHPKYPDNNGVNFNILILTNLVSVFLANRFLEKRKIGKGTKTS